MRPVWALQIVFFLYDSIAISLVFSDMGAHVDGFCAVLAHTLVVGASKENPVTGRKADVVMAAHLASQAAMRLVKAGNQNTAVTEAVQTVAESFNCKPVEGMVSHQLKQHVIDGEKAIIQNPSDAQRSVNQPPWPLNVKAEFSWSVCDFLCRKEHETCDFEVHEVYGVDVLITTGGGKVRVLFSDLFEPDLSLITLFAF